MKTWLTNIAIALSIPILGLVVSQLILADINAEFATASLPPIEIVCALPEVANNPELSGGCDEAGTLQAMTTASLIAAALPTGTFAIFFLASLAAGRNRRALAAIFPPLTTLSILVVAVTVLLQGALLVGSIYYGESYLTGKVHVGVVGLIGLAACVACLSLIASAFSMLRRSSTSVSGQLVTRETAPELHALIEETASKLGAQPPRNVVIGLEPTFFATAATVRLVGTTTKLTGESLFLSAPLVRMFTRGELTAVIGHELAHFSGADTAYSLRFAPVYRGLGTALSAMNGADGEQSFVTLPAASLLGGLISLFEKNEKAVGRERELEADAAGARVSSPDDLASALVKVSVFAPAWPKITQSAIDRLNQGKIVRNLSTTFLDFARFDVDRAAIDEVAAASLASVISHPTDTHPPLAQRLEALQVKATGVIERLDASPGEHAGKLLLNLPEVEQQLTTQSHQIHLALGLARLPSEEDCEGDAALFLRAAYMLAAHLVLADRSVEVSEVHVAEDLGREVLSADFDVVEFREILGHPDDLPPLKDLLALFADVMKPATLVQIADYLAAIADADGDRSEDEAAIIAKVDSAWSLRDEVPASS